MKLLSLLLAILICLPLMLSCSSGLEAVETSEETVESVSTEETVEEDPAKDGVLKILMIGNSACYYYVEELYGIAHAAGIEMKIGNVYYSGCRLEQHWNWWKLRENHYRYFETDGRGRRLALDKTGLIPCLERDNWDAISLQEAFSPQKAADRDLCFDQCEPYMKQLDAFLRETFPQSRMLWHQTWSYEVGYAQANGVIDSKDAQLAQHNTVRDVALHLCKTYDLERVPVGDAWQIARDNPVIGDTLCHKNGTVGDYLHDGDTGGGQYLNACVWFEVLTGGSCIGNTWRPPYALSEEKIAALQEAAHLAVVQMGE